MSEEESWYARLRERWKPGSVRLLLIGESAPDPGDSQRRFFYSPTLTRNDNLFRGVAAALYPDVVQTTGSAKLVVHERLLQDGVFLIDLVPFPVNGLKTGRASARRAHAETAVDAAAALHPEGIVVCHKPSHKVLAPKLRARDLPLLHDEGIPFPLGNHRAAFVRGVREALAGSPLADLAPRLS